MCEVDFVDDESNMLECEVCELHYCHACLKLSDHEYEFLSKREDMHWFCARCEGGTLLSIKTDREIAERCADYFRILEDKIKNMETDMGAKADMQQLIQLEEVVDTKVDKAQLDQLADRVSKIERNFGNRASGTPGGSEAARDPEEMVNNNLTELRDRESRKENLVLFNIPESTSDDTENRKLYDIAQTSELLESELNVQTQVANPVRLGKKQLNSRYPRPLRVTVESEQTKWKILKAAKNLKESRKEEYKVVFIKRDMTRMERAQEEDLRKQLADKRKEAEEKDEQCTWIIRRGKLVNQQRTERITQ